MQLSTPFMQVGLDNLVRRVPIRHTDDVGQRPTPDQESPIMNVRISENPEIPDIEVSIVCPRIDNRVQRIVASLNTFDRKITGTHEGAMHRIDLEALYYAESVDGTTFLYTKDTVLETPLRLYEMEDKLAGTEFIRISKQMIVNFDRVTSIQPALNARLQLMLDNGESVMASRQYAPAIKRKLGL